MVTKKKTFHSRNYSSCAAFRLVSTYHKWMEQDISKAHFNTDGSIL
jgi:hypothetical protein